MFQRIFILSVLAASVAQADIFTIGRTSDVASDLYAFGVNDCGTSVPSLTWSYTKVSGQVCSIKFWVTPGNCGDVIGANDFDLGAGQVSTTSLVSTGTLTVGFDALKGFNVDAGCGVREVEINHKVCGVAETNFTICGSNNSKVTANPAFRINYDAKPPIQPIITAIGNEDNSVKVSYTTADDTAQVRAEATPAAGGATITATASNASTTAGMNNTSGFVKLTGLENATVYNVVVIAIDAAGNESAPSVAFQGKPTLTEGFWAVLKKGGTTEPTGGCAAAPSLMVFAGLMLMLRRRSST
jgi:hypothetical protein